MNSNYGMNVYQHCVPVIHNVIHNKKTLLYIVKLSILLIFERNSPKMLKYITLSGILVLFYTDLGFCENFNCVSTQYTVRLICIKT